MRAAPAQQQLTRTLLGGRGGQTQADVDEEPLQSGNEQETTTAATPMAAPFPTDINSRPPLQPGVGDPLRT